MKTATPQLTPAMQYREFKQQYPGYVLFFRMGDFYELFDADAELGVRVLGVTVHNLGRPGDKAVPVPGETFRVGVPHQLIEGCLRRMIAAGLKVAICEPVDDGATVKGTVRREVIKTMEPDGSGDNHERDRCEMAAATATKKKTSKASKPASTKKAAEPVLAAAESGSGLSVNLGDDDRKALAEVLPRFKKYLDSGTMSTICGNDVAAAAVAKLIATVE